LVLLAGCGDDGISPPDPQDYPAILEPSPQWAGGQIALRWGFLAIDTPRFVLAPASEGGYADQLGFARTSDTTASLTISRRRAAGPATVLAILESGDTVALGGVSVAGQAGGVYDGPISCPIYPWPHSQPTELLSCRDGRVVLIDGTTGEATTPAGLENRVTWDAGFGVSFRPGVLYLPDGPDGVIGWDLSPGGGPLGRTDLVHGGHPVVELSPGLWGILEVGGLRVLDPGGDRLVPIDAPNRVIFSPDGSRLVVLSGAAGAGLPVLTAADGMVAYRLPPFRAALAAQFLPSPGSLFVLVEAGYGTYLYEADEVDGSFLSAGIPFSGAYVMDFVVDEDRGRLLLVEEIGDGLYLRVAERYSLETIALLQQPVGGLCGGCVPYHAALLAPDHARVTAAVGDARYQFTLLP
jgi:hypothetical protein